MSEGAYRDATQIGIRRRGERPGLMFRCRRENRGAYGGSSEVPSRWDSGLFRRITETDSPLDGMKRPNGRPALEGKTSGGTGPRVGIAESGRETPFVSSSIAISGTRHPKRSIFFGIWDQLPSVRDERPPQVPINPRIGFCDGDAPAGVSGLVWVRSVPVQRGIRRRGENPPGPGRFFSFFFGELFSPIRGVGRVRFGAWKAGCLSWSNGARYQRKAPRPER